MHLAIRPLLLLLGTGLLVTVLAEREQELSYYGISGDGRPTGSSSAVNRLSSNNNNNNPASGTGQDAEPPETGHPLPPSQHQQLRAFELLLPRLVALARHRFLPAAARPFWLGDKAQGSDDVSGYGPMEADTEEEEAADRVGVESQSNGIEKCKSSVCNDIFTKRDRTPILSIQAPIESLRQRIQWELRKKQEERNRKILDSIKRKLHYD